MQQTRTVEVNVNGHLGRGDHLEYLALDEFDLGEDSVRGAVRSAFCKKFGAGVGLCATLTATKHPDSPYWTVCVYPARNGF